MTKTFTSDDVVRYVYEETSPEENLLIEESLMTEPDMMTFFLSALELRSLMNKIERQPRESLIQSILSYSQNHSANPPAQLRPSR